MRLIGFVWIAALGASLCTAEFMSTRNHQLIGRRDLIWEENEYPCDEKTWALLRSWHPTADTCKAGNIRWDPNGVLTAVSIFTSGEPIYDDIASIRSSALNHIGIYTSPAVGAVQCKYFDYCIESTDTPWNTILNEYTYDCSNIYCGPNAIRHCGGSTETVPCTEGLISSPEIPTHAEVKCTKDRAAVEVIDAALHSMCSECTGSVEEAGEIHSFGCDMGHCAGCYPDGNCHLDETLTQLYVGSYTGTNHCYTLSSTGDRICFTAVAGSMVLSFFDGLLYPFDSGCDTTWNGQACSCSVCSHDENGVPLLKADCSAASGVENTIYDMCNNMFTGGFAYHADHQVFDTKATCPDDPTMPQLAPPKQTNSTAETEAQPVYATLESMMRTDSATLAAGRDVDFESSTNAPPSSVVSSAGEAFSFGFAILVTNLIMVLV